MFRQIRAFFRGLGDYFRANRLIFKEGLWTYLLVPGIVSIGLVLALISLGGFYFDDISLYIKDNWLPAMLQVEAMFWVIAIFLWVLMLVIGYLIYRPLMLIIFAPILGMLAEKIEAIAGGASPADFSLKQLFRDLGRSSRINLRYTSWSLALTAIASLLVFIPVAGAILSSVILLLIQSYYSGAGLFDMSLERRQLAVKESVAFVQARRGRVIGVGAGFVLLLLIPFLGWFLAPAYGTVAATLAAIDEQKNIDG